MYINVCVYIYISLLLTSIHIHLKTCMQCIKTDSKKINGKDIYTK